MTFDHPCTILVSGPTGCGKSNFVARFICAQLLDPPPNKIIWLYSEWQPLYDALLLSDAPVEFVKGEGEEALVRVFDAINPNIRNLLVLDDLMDTAGNSATVQKIFTQGSHHRNLTVIYLVQKLFHQGKAQRSISLNAHYIVLFKNPRDKTQIGILARQMFPNRWQFLVDAFEHATRKPFAYLVLDLRPDTPDEMRVRAKVFPDETPAVYIPAD